MSPYFFAYVALAVVIGTFHVIVWRAIFRIWDGGDER